MFPPHANPEGDCLLARWRKDRPTAASVAWPEGFAGGIAHRLDVGTSGAVAAAGSIDELEALRQAFRTKQLRKTYRFVSRRSVAWDDGGCDRAIAHDRRRKRRMVVQRGASTPHRGKWLPAETRFVRVGEGPQGTVWEATMRTGVMHQIRVHAAFVGLVLAGDPIYGGGEPVMGGAPFALHHVGFEGAGFATESVDFPLWAVVGSVRP